MTSSICIDKIKLDGGTQSRAALNDAVVEDYAQIIRDGADFPPVVVFHDGKRYWLADGFHRVAAYRAAGAVEIAADIRQGDKRDAILFSVGANAAHGLRRTNDDKRRAVMVLLNDKEWSRWSDRQIAKQCGVSHNFVSTLRPSLSSDDSEPRTFTTKHGSVSKMDTAAIGRHQSIPAGEESPQQEPHDQDKFDRQREAFARELPPDIQALEAAKAERRAGGAIADDWSDADDVAELRAVVEQQAEEITDLRRTVAKYDGMVVEYEAGGFENVITGLKQRIDNLNRQVERESQEKVSNLRKAEFWKRKAQEAGATDDYTVDMATGELARG